MRKTEAMAWLLTGPATLPSAMPATAADKQPNIVVITGDEIGRFNVGAYRRTWTHSPFALA